MTERERWIKVIEEEIDTARRIGIGEGPFAVILTLQGILEDMGVKDEELHMSSQADKLRALIINIAVIANTLNRSLFQLTKILQDITDLGDSDGTISEELWTKANELRTSICDFKNLCDRKY